MNKTIVYNWKSYLSSKNEALALARKLSSSSSVTQIACPSAVHLSTVSSLLEKKGIKLCAQDIAISAGGTHTGRSTAKQLCDLGVTHTLIGHAETRAVGVTNELVLEKIEHAIKHNIIPIICLSSKGTTNEQTTKATVAHLEQISTILPPSTPFLLAYEPLQHIGAKQALSPELVRFTVDLLRTTLSNHAFSSPILYGGAVNTDNAASLLTSGGIDGFLLGRASVDSISREQILRLC